MTEQRAAGQHGPGPSAMLRRLGAVALTALAIGSTVPPAFADYAVSSGEVLEIAVAGMPALHRRVTVNADGAISFPLLGLVPVGGLSVAGIRDRMQGLLSSRNLAANPDVTVDMVEYRPVYVMGDVLKPGAYGYRPGLSVRNAVALAGGYDQQQLQGRNPLLEATTARGDYELAAVELVKQQARIARLKAELNGQQQLDITDMSKNSVRPSALAEIIRIENDQLQLDLQSKIKESDYYARLRKTTEDQIAQLVQEEDFWNKSSQQQTSDLNRNQGLLQRSVGTMARVDDSQQRVLQTQSRLFDVRARLAQLRHDLSENVRKQEVAIDDSRSTLLQQLRDAVIELTKMLYAVDTASDKIRLSGRVQQRGNPPRVLVFEPTDTQKGGTVASEDTILMPGETVDITLDDKNWMSGSAGATAPAQLSDAEARPASAKPSGK